MRAFLVFLSLSLPLLAQPIQVGDIEIDAESVDSQHARLRACWVSDEAVGPFWRASLEENKASLQVGHQEDLGPLQGTVQLEQEWQDELEVRKASLVVRRNSQWELGQSARWCDNTVSWSGWLSTQLGEDWKARGDWQLGDDFRSTQLTLAHGSSQLMVERRQQTEALSYRGRLSQRLAQGIWELEAERRFGEGWDRQLSAGVRYRLSRSWEISAQGRRRWENLESQDSAEAQLRLSW